MLNVIRDGLQQIIDDIDSGNSNISEEKQMQILSILNPQEMSKTQAADYLNVSTSTFNNYVSKGYIPKGIKKQGISSKLWYKHDLDNYLKNKK